MQVLGLAQGRELVQARVPAQAQALVPGLVLALDQGLPDRHREQLVLVLVLVLAQEQVPAQDPGLLGHPPVQVQALGLGLALVRVPELVPAPGRALVRVPVRVQVPVRVLAQEPG